MAAKKAKKKTRKRAAKAAPRRKKSTKSTPAKGRSKWPKWADDFIEALADLGNVTKAAATVGLERSRPYQVRRENAQFAKLMASAYRIGKVMRYEELQENSLGRATDGYSEDVFDSEGNLTGKRQRFFPQLEMFHLRMGLPKEFNLANGDTTGGVGGDTPEQQASKVRGYLIALEGSVPK